MIVYTRNKSFNLPGKKFVGVNTITYQDLRWKRRDIKTVNLLPNIIAANMAKKKNAYEAILIQNGKVTEGTSSNIWIIKRNNFDPLIKSNKDIPYLVDQHLLEKDNAQNKS